MFTFSFCVGRIYVLESCISLRLFNISCAFVFLYFLHGSVYLSDVCVRCIYLIVQGPRHVGSMICGFLPYWFEARSLTNPKLSFFFFFLIRLVGWQAPGFCMTQPPSDGITFCFRLCENLCLSPFLKGLKHFWLAGFLIIFLYFESASQCPAWLLRVIW